MNKIYNYIVTSISLLVNNILNSNKPIIKINNILKPIKYPNEIKNTIRYKRSYLLEDKYWIVIDLEFDISNNVSLKDNKIKLTKTKSKVIKEDIYVDRPIYT